MGEIVSDRVHCSPPTPQNPLPLPLQLPQTVICSLLEMKSKGKKRAQSSKNTGGEEAERQLLEYSHLFWDASLLLTGDNCFGGPSPLHVSGAFS